MTSYRALVTTEQKFNLPEIMAHAHRKARHEFNSYLILEAELKIDPHGPLGSVWAETAKLAATVDRSKFKPCFSYATLFARELRNAFAWARAIRDAGQGEAPARSVPMFREQMAA